MGHYTYRQIPSPVGKREMGLVTDRMLYFVLADYGHRGHAFVETDIARNSLRLQGGDLWAENTGQGLRMIMRLPARGTRPF